MDLIIIYIVVVEGCMSNSWHGFLRQIFQPGNIGTARARKQGNIMKNSMAIFQVFIMRKKLVCKVY